MQLLVVRIFVCVGYILRNQVERRYRIRMIQESEDFTIMSHETQPDAYIIELPHIEQAANWDCGLACIQMVLPKNLGIQFHQNLSTICPEEYQNKSTWTIDLCYILNHFSIKIKYYTKTLGVNPSFSQEKFYDSYILKDEARVNQRFAAAASKGIAIETSSLEITELINHIKQNGVVIALIDANQLDCVSCKSLANNFGNFLKTLFKPQVPFNGHYIVICGFDTKKKLIYYRDPAVKSELCCLTYCSFEKTRRAHGTDEDIILIHR